MLDAKTIREIQGEVVQVIDEKGAKVFKITSCIAGLEMYLDDLNNINPIEEEKELDITLLKIGMVADVISETVDDILGIKNNAIDSFGEQMQKDEIFEHLDKMCEVTE